MAPNRNQRRALTAVFVAAGLLLAAVTVGYLVLVHLSLDAVRAGRTSFVLFGLELEHPLIARILPRFADNPAGPWIALLESEIYSRFLLGLAACVGLATALVLRGAVARGLRSFFGASTHPVNLAIFRIAIFGFAAFIVGRDHVALFASLPAEFLDPPVGSAWWIDRIPIDPASARVAHTAFVVTTLAAAAGFATRVSTIAALVLGIYVLGIPNFYGKVDHYNHIVWLMAILAASPCADALSVDAWIRARRSGSGRPPPAPANRYALPLRFAWLAIGLCYFFPGFWKLYHGGLAWALGDTFQMILYRQWVQIPDFQPLFALDRYPLLYRAAASTAVLFEVTFVFLVLHPVLRRIGVVLGLAFHNATGLLMGIWFLPMQIAYVAFVDWHGAMGWIRRRWAPATSPGDARDSGSSRASDALPAPNVSASRAHRRAVTAVGSVVLGAAVVFGALKVEHAWPFGAYPSFARVSHPRYETLRVERLDPDGTAHEVDLSAFVRHVTYPKFGPLVHNAATTEDVAVRTRKLSVLHDMIVDTVPFLDASDRVRVRWVELSADPHDARANPVSDVVLAEFGRDGSAP